MATLALSAVGAAVGGALLPGVGLFGAAIGQAAGAFAGAAIDQALFGASGRARVVEGPRLADLQVMTSSEGASIGPEISASRQTMTSPSRLAFLNSSTKESPGRT